MQINFIPNDPLTQDVLPMRQQGPLPERPEDLAGFIYRGDPIGGKSEPPEEGEYAFGTQEFLFWQCREAALAAIKTWETLNGTLTQWARAKPNAKKLRLIQNYAFNEINAQYTGNSLLFFIFKTQDNKITYVGASTDVVAHETGHAFLDVVRPDLWNSAYFEVSAFHESFADCMSLLTALADVNMRVAVLSKLSSPNFIETLGEDIADGIRRLYESIPEEDQQRGSLENATGPRHALNDFKWQLPESLPASGPPSELVGEIHSFSQVFTGCFYDALRNIFASRPKQDEKALWTATETAGKLLIAAASSAPEHPRFFQTVGRAMILTDEQLNHGVNRLAIRDAFARHDIALGSSAMLAPIASLAGTSPRLAPKAKGPGLSASTRKDLLERIKASPRDKLNVTVVNIAGTPLVQALHYRGVRLDTLDKRLKGVVAFGCESILVGTSGNRAAVLGSLPEATTINKEVMFFVESLLRQNSILFDKAPKSTPSLKGDKGAPYSLPVTHIVRSRGGKKVLTRIKFICKP